MKTRRIAWFVVLTAALAGCTQGASQSSRTSAFPSTSPTVVASSAAASSSAAPYLFSRTVISTPFGDPPRVDLCATLGTTLFQSLGYFVVEPGGQRAGSCAYLLNDTPTVSTKRPQAYVFVSIDPSRASSPGFSPVSKVIVGGFPVQVIKPTSASAPCREDLVTGVVDVVVNAVSETSALSVSDRCAMAQAVEARAAAVLHGQASVVKRGLSADTLINDNVCDALAGTGDYTDLHGVREPFGFGAGCNYSTVGALWTFEIRFGVQPGDPRTAEVDIGGHHFVADLEPASGTCNYRWEGPVVPGASVHEELTIARQQNTKYITESCADVGELAGQLVSVLNRH
jgi:hypothetical protein